ncbi:MAG: HEAT repeat domain-containing protein, partial [Planctomycetaceae bacterium]|nr:HEAT repeat domain-containing protein [Planctomycetaceae bacterium]
RGRDFSFDPKKLDITPESGGAQHGMSFDEWGHKFVCSNSDHIQAVMIDERYLARNPYLAVPRSRISIAADGGQAEVYRKSPVEPWRLVRTRLRVAGLVRGPVEGGGWAAGYFTGSTGVTIYKGNAWPKAYHGQAIVGDVGSNIVHRKILEWNGLVPIARRVDEKREFVTSTDIWFRPVQFANAPDGTIHILDMYREVIEHPASLPPEIKKHLDLTSGRDRGRLYRVLPEGFQQPELPKLSQLETPELVSVLNNSNAWHRETAARLLYEREDRSAVEPLRKLVGSAELPQTRMQALYVLDGLKALEESEVLTGLNDKHPQVRRHAIRLSEGGTLKVPAVRKQLLEMVEDPDLEVRYQLALTLGDLQSPQTAGALATLTKNAPGNQWMEWAVLSSLSNQAGDVFSQLANEKSFVKQTAGLAFLQELAQLIGRSGRQDDVAHVLKSITPLSAQSQSTATTVVQSLIAGLSKSQSQL